jgi:hypothetical protein
MACIGYAWKYHFHGFDVFLRSSVLINEIGETRAREGPRGRESESPIIEKVHGPTLRFV